MTASALRLGSGPVRTRWSMAASVGLHALLLMWLVLFYHESPTRPPLTEIAWIDAEPGADAGATASSVPRLTAPLAGAVPRLRRERTEANPAPVSDDALEVRLAALQGGAAPAAVAASAPAPAQISVAAPATLAAGNGSGGTAMALHRAGGGGGPALELARGSGAMSRPAIVATGLPAEHAAGAAAAPAAGEAVARRALAGALLMGPVADRPILGQVTPAYPEWAKREAVEASVTLYFVVRADGTVRENVLVQKTAGFEDFDEGARAALRAWRFQPLRGGRTGEQWGTITFHFRLREAG
jgi:TonB family protein